MGSPMTAFWVVAALFVVGALVMLLPALWRPTATGEGVEQAALAVHRDHWREVQADVAAGLLPADRLTQAQAEIRKRALEDGRPGSSAWSMVPARRTAMVVGLLVPLASVGLYLQTGRPDVVAPTPGPATAATAQGHTMTEAQIVERVAALAERLRADPSNAQGWEMLGRSYTALGRYSDGAMALRRAAELAPGRPGLLADLADVTAMAQGRRLAGEPARLIQQALDIDPRHAKSLALAGSVAFEAADYASAQAYWQRLVAVLPPDSEMTRSVRASLDEAAQMEARAGGATAGPVAAAPPPAAPSASAAVNGRVAGTVRIAPALAARVQPGDTLFVFARAADGPRMPLAVWRRPADGLPTPFALDDSMAMSPTLRLSGVAQVVIGARISRSGTALPQSGDLVGQSAVVAPGASDVEVVIDRAQP